MQKIKQTPGATLQALLERHGLNCNRLAKAINMSNAMVRLLVLDKSPVSVTAAFRLAQFFKTKPEYWLSMQMQYDLTKAAEDKALAKELNSITSVDNYSFVRKPHATQKTQTSKKEAVPPKKGKATTVKQARKPRAK